MTPSSPLKRSIWLPSAVPGQFRKLKDLVSHIWSGKEQQLRTTEGAGGQQGMAVEDEQNEVGRQCQNQAEKNRNAVVRRRGRFVQNSRTQLTALKKQLFRKRQAKTACDNAPTARIETGLDNGEVVQESSRIVQHHVNYIYISNV